MGDTFRCGHPKTPENSRTYPSCTRPRCWTCLQDISSRRVRSGKPRGRPLDISRLPAIGITAEDRAWDEMVKNGSALLLSAVQKIGGHVA